MLQTPLAERLKVVLAGPRNAGKSSLLNVLLEKEASLVSSRPGTTTDPVTRAFEIPGLGPASVTDTPGLDDDEEVLGAQRVRLALSRAAEADLRILVTPGHLPPSPREAELLAEWRESDAERTILVLSFAGPEDSARPEDHPEKAAWAASLTTVRTDAPSGRGITELVAAMTKARPEREIGPLEGLATEGGSILLVTPIDLAAPAGRLIAPQVQVIRDALDKDIMVTVVKERELRAAYANMKTPPSLVITDSQAFSKVAADLPEDQPLTSFSILFARKKGDLNAFLNGLAAAASVQSAPHVLILESCSHHRQADDIGTVKIPRLFRQMVRDDAEFTHLRTLPADEELARFHLVIHCGACRLTRTQMSVRLKALADSGTPVTNYGMFLAWVNGLMPRALEPFDGLCERWNELRGARVPG